MKFDQFFQQFQGIPPTLTPEKQVSWVQRLKCTVQRIISTAFWGAILLLGCAVLSDAITSSRGRSNGIREVDSSLPRTESDAGAMGRSGFSDQLNRKEDVGASSRNGKTRSTRQFR